MSNGHIFISYRRDDSAGYTRAIYNQLVKRFSKERVFMDVDTIEPGLPFDEAINQAVGHCEILIAIIGKRWMEEKPGADPRIDDAKDFVRLEIAAALSRNIRVIPVLLDGAVMPTEEALPEPLRALARRNAIEISNSRFDSDIAKLVEVVCKVLGETNVVNGQEGLRSSRPLRYWLVGGFIAVAIVYGVVYIYSSRPGTLLMASPVMAAERLMNLSSEYCLDTDGRAENGGVVRMWKCATHPNQRWIETKVGSNFYQLRNISSKFCLDTDGSKINGAQVRMWGCANHPNQLWEILDLPTPTGGSRLKNKASGLCLDTDGRAENGAQVRMWECATHPHQSWKRGVMIDED